MNSISALNSSPNLYRDYQVGPVESSQAQVNGGGGTAGGGDTQPEVPPDDEVPPSSSLIASDSVTLSSGAQAITTESGVTPSGGQESAREAVGGLIDITG